MTPGHLQPASTNAVLPNDGIEAPKLLRIFLDALIAVLVPVVVLTFAGNPLPGQRLTLSAMIAGVALARLILWRGHTLTALYVLLTVMVAGCAAFQAASGTIRNAAILGFVVAMILGALFLGARALSAITLICSSCLGVVVAAAQQGLLPPPDHRLNATNWLGYTAALTAVAAGLYLIRNLILENIARLREELSQRVAAQAALAKSEERFHKAFNASPIGMMISRVSDGRFIEVNEADQRTLGYSRSELIGRTGVELGLWESEEARARYLGQLAIDGRVDGYSVRARSRAGTLEHCKVWAVLTEFDGEPCVLATTMNLTAQQRDETLLSEIARGTSQHTDLEFFRALVAHLARALGADMAKVSEFAEAGRVRTIAVLRDGLLQPNFDFASAGTPCGAPLGRNGICLYADDVEKHFPDDPLLREQNVRGYIGAQLTDPQGEPIGFLSALFRRPMERSDRLEAIFRIFAARAGAELVRMRHEAEILHLNEDLERRVRERTEELEAFSYSVSHDLRAPVRQIAGFTRFLRDSLAGQLDERQAHLMDRIGAATQRMDHLIAAMLELSRVGRSEMRKVPLDLPALAEEVLTALAQAEPERTVERRVARDGPQVLADPRLMRIVLDNLLGNAWKFTARTEGARIEFGYVPAPDGGGAWQVRDNGAGFDPDYAHKLFVAFERLHGDSEFDGTGVGLAIVQRIIARHDGAIGAEGRPGEGAVFRFRLPAAN